MKRVARPGSSEARLFRAWRARGRCRWSRIGNTMWTVPGLSGRPEGGETRQRDGDLLVVAAGTATSAS